jgi:LAS superfamily LD-carboxypeptidase LdcB
MLTLIGISQHRLWGPAAETFKAMRAAAAADGVALSVTDSYRPYDEQVDLARRKGLTKDGGWAAVPGTSNHGWGLAIDADVDANGLAWLNANGARFGWVMESTREPWHWQYCGPT